MFRNFRAEHRAEFIATMLANGVDEEALGPQRAGQLKMLLNAFDRTTTARSIRRNGRRVVDFLIKRSMQKQQAAPAGSPESPPILISSVPRTSSDHWIDTQKRRTMRAPAAPELSGASATAEQYHDASERGWIRWPGPEQQRRDPFCGD